MKCKNVRKMIWLSPRELATDERLILESHTESCASCRRELAERMAIIAVVASIKNAPVLDQPQQFTIDVMRRVRRPASALTPLDRLLDFFGRRSVRLAFAGIFMVMMLFFTAHEITLMRRIRRLEQQVAAQCERSPALSSALSLQANDISPEQLNAALELLRRHPLLLRAVEQQARLDFEDGISPDDIARLLQQKSVQEKLKSY